MQQDLGEFATDGLRTLVCGFKVLSADDAEAWLKTFKEASAMVGPARDKALASAAEKVESEIYVLGATGIEDKLQDGVPDAIDKLLKAGIKLWVLTGDKKETAIEIGHATNLLDESMPVIEFDGDNESADVIRGRLAREFIRLVKAGMLPKYSKRFVLDRSVPLTLRCKNLFRSMFHKPPLLTTNAKNLQIRLHAKRLAAGVAAEEGQAPVFVKAKLARRASRR